jgi:hypothetical protein
MLPKLLGKATKAMTSTIASTVVFFPTFFFFPTFLLLLAALLEHVRDARSLHNLARALPIAIGILLAIPLSVPLHRYFPAAASSLWLSRTMAVTSIVIAACGFLSRYRSRAAAAFVILGSTTLAVLWLFNHIAT